MATVWPALMATSSIPKRMQPHLVGMGRRTSAVTCAWAGSSRARASTNDDRCDNASGGEARPKRSAALLAARRPGRFGSKPNGSPALPLAVSRWLLIGTRPLWEVKSRGEIGGCAPRRAGRRKLDRRCRARGRPSTRARVVIDHDSDIAMPRLKLISSIPILRSRRGDRRCPGTQSTPGRPSHQRCATPGRLLRRRP